MPAKPAMHRIKHIPLTSRSPGAEGQYPLPPSTHKRTKLHPATVKTDEPGNEHNRAVKRGGVAPNINGGFFSDPSDCTAD